MQTSAPRIPRDSFAFAALISGAYASAAIALLFLGVDAFRGNALFTPSLLGTVVFLGELSAAAPVRAEMVALYSLFHLVVFLTVSTSATLLYVASETLRRHPVLLAGLLLAALSIGVATADMFVPGLVATVGAGWILLANTAAAGVMTVGIHKSVTAAIPELAAATARTPRS